MRRNERYDSVCERTEFRAYSRPQKDEPLISPGIREICRNRLVRCALNGLFALNVNSFVFTVSDRYDGQSRAEIEQVWEKGSKINYGLEIINFTLKPGRELAYLVFGKGEDKPKGDGIDLIS